jgi:5-carboxymethyl-2-hydroxymuconate isomerase
MPHIILETTSDLPENANVPDVLDALVEKLASFDTIEAKSIKAYHSLRSVWSVGEGHAPGFAHCTVKLMTGRAPELKKQIATGLFQVLKEAFADSVGSGEAGVTLELHEMDRDTYQKL